MHLIQHCKNQNLVVYNVELNKFITDNLYKKILNIAILNDFSLLSCWSTSLCIIYMYMYICACLVRKYTTITITTTITLL